MEHDMVVWGEIANLLARDRETFSDPEHGLWKKRQYMDRWLPELQDGRPRRVLDIGAGTGSFCHVCQELGHEALAVLSGRKPEPGYMAACKYYGVSFIEFTWGSEPADLEDDSFDVVNSQGMMGDNDAEVWSFMLDDMLRVLKPGGILLLAANHETGTKHAGTVNDWTKNANVEQLEYHVRQTLWKWHKK